MNQSRKIKKQSYKINRREFFKEVPCAAIGGLFLSGLTGLALKDYTLRPSSKDPLYRKEESMAKKTSEVTAKAVSKKGVCALGHKVGDVVKFTESGVEGKICIHALYSMLPAVFAMMFEARFPWLKDSDKKTHACPDAANPVVFEIIRIRKE